MKMRTYNNLIPLFLSVCSFLLVFWGTSAVFAQEDDSTLESDGKKEYLLEYTGGNENLLGARLADLINTSNWGSVTSVSFFVGDLEDEISVSCNDAGYGPGTSTTLLPASIDLSNREVKIPGGHEKLHQYFTTKFPSLNVDELKVSYLGCDSRKEFYIYKTGSKKEQEKGGGGLQGGFNQSITTQPTSAASLVVSGGKVRTLSLYSELFEGSKLTTSGGDPAAVGAQVQNIFARLFSVIFTIAGTLMVVLIAIHGTKMIYAEARGSVNSVLDERKKLNDIFLGVLILLTSWIILNFVDPDLLKPKFFDNILKLRSINSDNAIVTTDITIPENGVSFKKDVGELTISACPVAGGEFDRQIQEISKSLGGEIEYAYMILYQIAGEEVYFYNIGDETGYPASVVRDEKQGKSIDYIFCKDGKIYKKKKEGGLEMVDRVIKSSDLKNDKLKVISVFPVVFVTKSTVGEYSEDRTQEKTSKEPLRTWRGVPWKYEQKGLGAENIREIREAISVKVLSCEKEMEIQESNKKNIYKVNTTFQLQGLDVWSGNSILVTTTVGGRGSRAIRPVVVRVEPHPFCEKISTLGCRRSVVAGSVVDVTKRGFDVFLYFGEEIKRICVDIVIPATLKDDRNRFYLENVRLDGHCFNVHLDKDLKSKPYGTVTCAE